MILQLLEITPALPALNGVVMELNDCAFPLVAGVVATDKLDIPHSAQARRAVSAGSFLCLKSCGIFIGLSGERTHQSAKLVTAIAIAFEHVEGRCARGK